MPLVLIAVLAAGIGLARAIHRGRWQDAGWQMRVHLSIGWAIVVLGLVHVGATWLLCSQLSNRALWFASGGIAMALGGALNLLQRLYAALAPGISPVCVAANLALTILSSLSVVLAGARVVRDPQFVLLLGLMLGTTWLSVPVVRVRSAR